jgi:hypothetical protein
MIRRIRIIEELNRSAGEATATSEQQGWGQGSGLQRRQVPDCRCPVRRFGPEKDVVVPWTTWDLAPRSAFSKENGRFSANHHARSAALVARCRSRTVLRCTVEYELNISNWGTSRSRGSRWFARLGRRNVARPLPAAFQGASSCIIRGCRNFNERQVPADFRQPGGGRHMLTLEPKAEVL